MHLIDLRTLRGDDQGLVECRKRLQALEADRNHDHSLWQLSDIAARSGRADEARQYLMHLIDLRTLRGDQQGLADCQKRLKALNVAATSSPPPAMAPGSEIDLSDALADLGGDT